MILVVVLENSFSMGWLFLGKQQAKVLKINDCSVLNLEEDMGITPVQGTWRVLEEGVSGMQKPSGGWSAMEF